MSNIPVDREKWEEFAKRSDGLMQEYEKLRKTMEEYEQLHKKVKDLEATKTALEEQLTESEAQKEELHQKLSSIVHVILRELSPLEERATVDPKSATEIKDLRSSISRLLRYSET